MKAIELKVYEILKNRFSEKEAETFIEYFDTKTTEKIDDKKDIFLTKNDKIDLMSFDFWITIIIMLLINFFFKKISSQ